MSSGVEDWRLALPGYLTDETDKKTIAKELAGLMAGARRGYILSQANDKFSGEMLQGDAWKGCPVYSFDIGGVRNVKALILSNSCDVSLDNKRATPPKVTFAPLIRLDKLEERLLQAGLSGEAVNAKLDSIRSQIATDVFFLPAEGPLEHDYCVLLQDIHSAPLARHLESASKMFTLSMAGFYLFIFKLSIHFCRLHENVNRS
ncbi:hypothetical protein [Paracoccus marcusii]|uniref:hypothetical protein n=1 Tax=Paracoccus marcusii TaxID=59779 RepID=UPI0035A64E0C